MKTQITAIVSSLALLLIGAAAHGQSSMNPNQELAIYTGSPKMNTVNIIDKNLQRTFVLESGQTHTSGKIGVEGAGQKVTATQTREVWVRLRNLTDYPQNILVRTTWYDQQEAPVDGPSAWNRISLGQNAGEIYRTQSISMDAAFFFVEIQEVR